MTHDLTLDPAPAFNTSILSRTRRRHAQTFPEMMIVVAIIAILAAVIIANLFHARGVAQVAAVEEQMRTIATAVEMYYNDYGVFPGNSGWQNVSPDLFGGAGNKYFNSTPIMPGTSNPYTYFQGGAGGAGNDPGPYYIGANGAFNPALLSNFTKTPWFGGGPCALTCIAIVYSPNFGFDAN